VGDAILNSIRSTLVLGRVRVRSGLSRATCKAQSYREECLAKGAER